MIHDPITDLEEHLGRERLREEISQILMRRDKGHHDFHVFHTLSNEQVTAFNVLHASVVLRVV